MDLGTAAGCVEASLHRMRVAPGARADLPPWPGEPVLMVVAGAGRCVEPGAPLRGGDVVLGAPGAVEAGPDGLEVLAFGAAGGPADGLRVVRADDVPGGRWGRGDVQVLLWQHLVVAGDGRRWGLSRQRVAPGARNTPPHCHAVEEELFYVVEGEGVLELGWPPSERRPVRAGDAVARPPATGVAHAFVAGEAGMTLLGWGRRAADEMCWYPRSRKVSLRALGVVVRVDAVDYWEGEG